MHKKFNHEEIEKKWQTEWLKNNLYTTDASSSKPKAYVLDMFPYPSGEGLHVGHPKGYIATDIYSRFKKMNGYEVLHPMGWDAFGLPAENFAIKNKIHPRVAVEKNIANFKAQLAKLGFNYDWSREINTTDPEYYKWTQWIFLKLLEKGLAYQSHEPINWCPSCQTGLANEDLESDGTCERCGSVVEKKPMRQWVLKITEYADRMLQDLDTLEAWPAHIKEAQRQWIGRSKGAEIDFLLNFKKDPSANENRGPNGERAQIPVFTTRPDTLYGATYLVLSPEHPWVTLATDESHDVLENKAEVLEYVKSARDKSEIERTNAGKEKMGVELKGVVAINPATGEEIPMYVADYVLAGYGTGAIMAVPAHDERDFEFAIKYSLESSIKCVIAVPDNVSRKELNSGSGVGVWYHQPLVTQLTDNETGKIRGFEYNVKTSICHTCDGKLTSSGEFDGMSSEDAKEAITKKVGGKMMSTYRLNDWVFSRQRYWGEPIPVIHCPSCGVVPVPYDELPVRLPEVEQYEPTGTGESPLATIDAWVNVPCPKCKHPAKRETNTMPQWAGSSWYYLRFIDPKNNQALIDPEKEKKWAPVDVYVGGDHAVRHLIYARFWHKFLYDIGVVHTIEPFMRLEFLGFILAPDGRKMSKRWGNVINPDDIVKQNGADTLRVYEMFMGPFENTIAWNTDSLVGAQRFLERVNGLNTHLTDTSSGETTRLLHKTIKKVSEDIEAFKFNTAVSALMIFINQAEKEGLDTETYKTFLTLLAPFAPHITEELWHVGGETSSIHTTAWPQADPKHLVLDTVSISVQINGKMRGLVTVPFDAPEDAVVEAVKASPDLREKVTGEILRVIFVKNKIINIILE